MYGAIASSWKKLGGKFTLDVTVPANTTATVWLPAKDGAKVTESGKPVEARREPGAAIVDVQSGTYSFTVQ
jgi:alpha-L-rhamnosidase